MIEKNDQPNRGIYRNIPSWYLYIILAILVFIFILVQMIFPHRPRRFAKRVICKVNLTALECAMRMYANDYDGKYPTADKWCDLLVSSSIVEFDRLFCRGSDAKKGQSSYCLNKNIAGKKSSEIPNNTVLLFETKKGWNHVGGPEKLTFDNHDGKYCGVLFKDGNVEFIKPDQLGQLKWDTEKQDSDSIE